MVGYRLKNTVSDNGTVSRGVCQLDSGSLRKVKETLKIKKYPDGPHYGHGEPSSGGPPGPGERGVHEFLGLYPLDF